MGVTYTGFKEVRESIDNLVVYLKSLNILLPPQSRLALALGHSHQVIESWESQSIPPGVDIHLYVSDLVNVWWLSSLIMHAKGTSFEAELIPKLVLLAKADPLPLTPGRSSTERNTMFEIILACVCSLFASDVGFEEPDVICIYKGVRWGLACKAAYGSSRQTAKDIRDGIKQIEASGAELGLVVVQMTNRFQHDKMYEVDHETGNIISLHDEKAQQNLFHRILVPITREIECETSTNLKRYPRKWDEKVRGILFVANTIAYFRGHRAVMGGSVFSRLSKLSAMPEDDFVQTINKCWQKI